MIALAMFPKTSLMLGSSLLWSIAPLQAANTSPNLFLETGASRKDKADGAAERVISLLKLIDRQRQENDNAETELSAAVVSGLQILFDRGDRRVMVLPEFLNPSDDTPPCRLREIHQLHLDLEDAALVAHTRAERRESFASPTYFETAKFPALLLE